MGQELALSLSHCWVALICGRRRRSEGEQAGVARGEAAAAGGGAGGGGRRGSRLRRRVSRASFGARRRRAAHRQGPRCILLCIPSLHGALIVEDVK
ncbi:hypothetical protein E2562_037526 [Oryza meyeriana var. granulata]|uniref:Uncharacterized protein n=1 Tax=Oryza meyeriana var. granulata TaxID=110450 RepID=A0A6G1E8G9_9ORYZ|nr:hypothetical protein E2562_037526 [Oryza meyeriana var. granulata]